jgi:hypothetical protein
MMMRGLCPFILMMALLDGALPPALADEPLSKDALLEDFTKQPEDREQFFTDPVMGGVSIAGFAFAQFVSTPPDVGRWRVNDGW